MLPRARLPFPVHGPRLHPRQSGARGRGLRHAQDAATASRCALRAGRRRRDARAPSACSRAAPNSSRNISRPCAICARAALRSRCSTGAGRAGRSGSCAIRARATCAASPTTTSISRPSCNDVVLPDCPPPVFALAHSMGATVLMRAAYQGHRWFDRMVLLAPMIGLPGLRRSAATRIAVRAMRHDRARRRLRAGRRRLGDAAAPLHRQSARPPIRCAMRATSRCWRPSRRSRSAGRRWRGRMPPSG